MNCDKPTIAVRYAGINPASGRNYKPHRFISFTDDKTFVKAYFDLKYLAHAYGDKEEVLILPCGKCLLCIQSHRRMWACRCINEAHISNGGMFLTLTCSDESQVRTFPNGSLDHRPWQLFVKRLRKHLVSYCEPVSDGYPLRFFMCGEYGEKSHRPHYHALIFGWRFRDPCWVGRSRSGGDLFTSPYLDELRYDPKSGQEIFGKVSNFADMSPYDISYTVGYIDKKLGRANPRIYEKENLKPEYICMSRRPAIGFDWLKKYHHDVWKFYQDTLLGESVWATSDFKYAVPRYYFDKAKISGLLLPSQCDIIQLHRRCRLSEVSSDPVRLTESLKRAHDRCAIKEHSLKVVTAPRDFFG